MFISSIISSLDEGEEVVLRSFGRFHFRTVPPRRIHNPKNGQFINAPARVKTVFTVGTKLADTAKNIEVKHG
jgi:nucleoid DNA-binding protein